MHSGDWLKALPIANCGLHLDDETLRLAVGMRLGTKLCHIHTCPCGALVDAHWIAFVSCAGKAMVNRQDTAYSMMSYGGHFCVPKSKLTKSH